MKIELVKIEDIRPYERNNKHHNEAQVVAIAQSIKEFGWTQPIVIDPDGVIIAGHGRYLAAETLSISKVPCYRVEMSEEKKRLYRIADNKLSADPDWDNEAIQAELLLLSGAEDFESPLLEWVEENFEMPVEKGKREKGDEGDRDVNFNIQYNIVFENEEQQTSWFEFVRHLGDVYPTLNTLGKRLQAMNSDRKRLQE